MAGLSTQEFLQIEKIKEGVVVLKNRGLRMILMASSLNFALKSDDEQNAIIYQFQSFLNSLDFFCQIVIQSRKINITGYLEKLKRLEEKEHNDLLKRQIEDYIKFIASLTEDSSIMQKSFYIVVPFSVLETQSSVGESTKKIIKAGEIKEDEFQRAKAQLWQRAEFVALGLQSCGLDVVPLDTSELIELFWSLHHIKESEKGYYPDLPPELTQ